MKTTPLCMRQAVHPTVGQTPPQGEARSWAHLSGTDCCAKLTALKQAVRPRDCGLPAGKGCTVMVVLVTTSCMQTGCRPGA